MFNESYMLWKGNNSPQNIGLTIVGYLYRQGIEKRAMGYACAVGLVLLIIVMVVNMIGGSYRNIQEGGKIVWAKREKIKTGFVQY